MKEVHICEVCKPKGITCVDVPSFNGRIVNKNIPNVTIHTLTPELIDMCKIRIANYTKGDRPIPPRR